MAPEKIRRLYESDARGLLDEDLLDEVGHALYARCADLLELAEAQRGRVKCRACGAIILRRQVNGHFDPAEILRCEHCSWEIACGEYHKSLLRKRPARAYEPEAAYRSFVERWPQAGSPSEKMLLIDSLIHTWHIQAQAAGSPLGASVVRATWREMIELLEGLACGPGSTAGLAQVREQWRYWLEKGRSNQ